MDQIKIGRFIAQQRKEHGLTQAQLAEKFNISDRAVSKWETGRAMPDSSIMLELCGLLDISVNELLSGEKIAMRDYDKAAEENLLRMKKQEEQSNGKLLAAEVVIGVMSTVAFAVMILAAAIAAQELAWKWVLIGTALVIFAVGLFFAMKLERESGYYKCGKCGSAYIPSWGSHMWAMHMGRTRYMKCPECGKWSWTKKVLSAEEKKG